MASRAPLIAGDASTWRSEGEQRLLYCVLCRPVADPGRLTADMLTSQPRWRQNDLPRAPLRTFQGSCVRGCATNDMAGFGPMSAGTPAMSGPVAGHQFEALWPQRKDDRRCNFMHVPLS